MIHCRELINHVFPGTAKTNSTEINEIVLVNKNKKCAEIFFFFWSIKE